jgi:hypothetical protein
MASLSVLLGQPQRCTETGLWEARKVHEEDLDPTKDCTEMCIVTNSYPLPISETSYVEVPGTLLGLLGVARA